MILSVLKFQVLLVLYPCERIFSPDWRNYSLVVLLDQEKAEVIHMDETRSNYDRYGSNQENVQDWPLHPNDY